MMLLNNEDKVFVGMRIDQISEAWQMPQGGIDAGESPREAALRELEEEIGTSNVEIVAETEDWLRYDLPPEIQGKVWGGKYCGQEQKWFLARFLGDDAEINIATGEPEFTEWQWVDPYKIPDLIVPFKRKLYQDLLKEFADFL